MAILVLHNHFLQLFIIVSLDELVSNHHILFPVWYSTSITHNQPIILKFIHFSYWWNSITLHWISFIRGVPGGRVNANILFTGSNNIFLITLTIAICVLHIHLSRSILSNIISNIFQTDLLKMTLLAVVSVDFQRMGSNSAILILGHCHSLCIRIIDSFISYWYWRMLKLGF